MTTPYPRVELGDLPEIDVFSEEFRAAPWEVTSRIHSPNGLARSSRGIEGLTYQSAHTVLGDRRPRIGFDEMYQATGFDESSPVYQAAVTSINNLEGDVHKVLRETLGRYFTRDFVQTLRPVVRSIAEEILDGFVPGEPVDIATRLVGKIPSRLFASLVGAPLGDAEFLEKTSDALLTVFYMDNANHEVVEKAYAGLAAYVEDLIRVRQSSPGDDVVSYLLDVERSGRITRHDVIVNVTALLRASTDTTAGQMGLVIAELAERPDVWERCHSEPGIIPAAVMEAVRWRTGAWSILRVVREDMNILGTPVPAGTDFFGLAVAAHRDPEAYPDPHTFRLDRRRPKPTLNWGMGVHYCLGKPIAQVEMEEVVRLLTERWTGVHLAKPLVTDGEPVNSRPLTALIGHTPR
ncbi:cytochrome P450 [Streptomyces fuscichromogenes]|uniref:cytochrome P450 n=1 Tax=Streptomyces fuscichromogenes TaxID=1324013 RepID=UPI00381B026C